MKTNPQHLQLLRHVVMEYVGYHPENRMCDTQFDVLYFQFKDTQYPHIAKLRMNYGWFFSKVEVWIDTSEAKDVPFEHHRLQISNEEIKMLFKEAAQAAKEEYKRRKAEERLEELKNLNSAIIRMVNK